MKVDFKNFLPMKVDFKSFEWNPSKHLSRIIHKHYLWHWKMHHICQVLFLMPFQIKKGLGIKDNNRLDKLHEVYTNYKNSDNSFVANRIMNTYLKYYFATYPKLSAVHSKTCKK